MTTTKELLEEIKFTFEREANEKQSPRSMLQILMDDYDYISDTQYFEVEHEIIETIGE